MSEKLLKLVRFSDDEDEQKAWQLYVDIMQRRGEDEAGRIFAAVRFREATEKERRNFQILWRYDLMEKQNVQELARQLAEENKTRPTADRYGNGATTEREMENHIRYLLKARRKADKTKGKSTR